MATRGLLYAVEALESAPEVRLTPEARGSIAATLDEMAAILRRGAYPVEVSLELPHETPALTPFAAALLNELLRAIRHFAEPQPEAPAPKSAERGFFSKDAFSNPEHTRMLRWRTFGLSQSLVGSIPLCQPHSDAWETP